MKKDNALFYPILFGTEDVYCVWIWMAADRHVPREQLEVPGVRPGPGCLSTAAPWIVVHGSVCSGTGRDHSFGPGS